MRTSCDRRNDGISPIPGLLPSASLFGDDEEDTALLLKMAQQAADYLLGFSWCQAVKESYFADGVGGIVAVFLLRIVPGKPGIPDWLWVLTGDIPGAYLPIEDAETASEALRKYLDASNLWVVMARQSKSDLEGIPFDVPTTPEWAEKLATRLKVIEKLVLPRAIAAEVQQASPY